MVKIKASISEKLMRSASQNVLEQATESPTSVLSENHSDTYARADTCTPEGSWSPLSSTLALDASASCAAEAPTRTEPVNENGQYNPDEEVSLVLAHFLKLVG